MQREQYRYKLDGKRAAELTDAEKDDAKRRLDGMGTGKDAAAAPADAAPAAAVADAVPAGERQQAIEEVKAELNDLIKLIDDSKPAA